MGLLPFYLLTLLLSMTGCKSNDDIVFDHERQQFETRADRILLEFIAPFGTTPDEEIYIIGPFNGNSLDPNAEGKYEDPTLDDACKLTKAPSGNAKWGIYLDPATFQGGKTLADGFRFYCENGAHMELPDFYEQSAVQELEIPAGTVGVLEGISKGYDAELSTEPFPD